jgi:LmbE family N-acetylglucosaminyl deacetylase
VAPAPPDRTAIRSRGIGAVGYGAVVPARPSDAEHVPADVSVDDSVPGRVLAVYAHPDDPEVSCAGTLARWAAAGAEVHLIIGTLGEKGRDPAADPGALTARRAGEAARAAEVMGLAGHESLGHPDGELDNTRALRADLVTRIRRRRPDVVVGPDPTAVFFGTSYVNHRDHRELGFALLDAVSPAAASPAYFPETGPAHRVRAVYLSGTLEPDTWVDIDATVDLKVRALQCHESQLGDDVDLAAEVVRRRAASAGRAAGLRHAEAFRVLRLA